MIEFKDEMPDYINKILKEKLPPSTRPYDQEDRVPLLAPVDKQFDPEMQHIPPPPPQTWTKWCRGYRYPN